jgi:AP2 domain-containing protein/HNH endonuclease
MTVTIELTQNFTAIIDDVDADLAVFKWHVNNGTDGNNYAVRAVYPDGRTGKKIRIWMHRLIVERIIQRPLEAGEKGDHINGDIHDNRRENLRVATIAQNSQNKKLAVNNTSGFKGVFLCKRTGKWVSRIGANGKYRHLGTFNTPEDAYAAYCYAAKELHGEYAKLPHAIDVPDTPPQTIGKSLKPTADLAGLSIEELVFNAVKDQGSKCGAARSLGVATATIHYWFNKAKRNSTLFQEAA